MYIQTKLTVFFSILSSDDGFITNNIAFFCHNEKLFSRHLFAIYELTADKINEGFYPVTFKNCNYLKFCKMFLNGHLLLFFPCRQDEMTTLDFS